MTKDSQPDNKKARMEKCNYQTPITEEGLNHNPNRKHKSVKRQGVSSGLIENGFLDDEDDMKIIFNHLDDYGKTIALAIAEGFGIA